MRINMIKKNKLLFIGIIVLLNLNLFAQNNHVDSLKIKILSKQSTDQLLQTQTIMEIADFYKNSDSDSALYYYSLIADAEITDENILNNQEISKYNSIACRRIGAIYLDYSDYLNAELFFNKALFIAEKIEDSELKAAALSNLGLTKQYLGLYEEGLSFYLQALEIDQGLNDSLSISYDLNNLANAYMYSNDYTQAIFYYEKALELAYAGSDYSQIAICLNNMGNVYLYQADYKSASEMFYKSLEIVKELEDYETIAYNLISLGNVNDGIDNYPQALKYFAEALSICEESKYIVQICQCYSGMGNVVEKQGNYKKAIELQQIALLNFRLIDDNLGISSCLNNIGIVKIKLGDFDSARFYIEESMKMKNELQDESGKSNCLFNLGTIATYLNNFAEAEEYFTQSMEISKNLDEIQGISKCLNNIGSLRMFSGDYAEAANYFESAYIIDLESGSKVALADYSHTLSQAYIKLGYYEKAIPVMLKSVQYSRDLLRENFAIMSESERELYLKQVQLVFDAFNDFSLCYPGEKSELYEISYDNELLMKGLLLNSTLALITAINNSNDEELKSAYFNLKMIRNEISYAQTIIFEGKNEYVAELETEAEKTEKLLLTKSSEFAGLQEIFDISWKDIRKSLPKGSAAIEFISINHKHYLYLESEKDSSTYVALIIKKDSQAPDFVKLCTNEELSALSQKSSNEINYVNELYRGVILKSVKNQLDIPDLYELIWEPLNDNLKRINSISYAPAGILHKISFAAIKNSEDKYISDLYSLNTVSCTKELIKAEQLHSTEFKNIAAFGLINYDYNKAHITELMSFYSDSAINHALSNRNFSGGVWTMLLGTQTELQNITNLFKLNKKETLSFEGNKALEEIVKNLSGSEAPDIIHIATHGFSISDLEDNTYLVFDNSFVKNSNPLYRSGLLFSGANATWNGIDPVPGTEDGILTAAEVSLLDLQNTELVVLSACETGLGEIRGSEGVYGFQRAFKMAGAKYLVMSLWQVPDNETAEFMFLFYKNLLKSNSIPESFKKAQKQMQKKYDPFYWAAFVLVK